MIKYNINIESKQGKNTRKKNVRKDKENPKSVLRIHLILMRVRILDPHWKKMDPAALLFISIKLTEFFFRLFLC